MTRTENTCHNLHATQPRNYQGYNNKKTKTMIFSFSTLFSPQECHINYLALWLCGCLPVCVCVCSMCVGLCTGERTRQRDLVSIAFGLWGANEINPIYEIKNMQKVLLLQKLITIIIISQVYVWLSGMQSGFGWWKEGHTLMIISGTERETDSLWTRDRSQ